MSAAIAREISYSTLCLGLYEPYKNLVGASDPNAPLHLQIIAGALTGMTGALPTSPTDLLKVRMQANTGTPMNLRWHIRQIYHVAGILGFYTGVKENLLCAGLRRGTSLATYD